MPKRRKDYRVAAPPETLIGTPGSFVVNFLDDWGKVTQSFDFSGHTARPQMAAEIALAFRCHHAAAAPRTRAGVFCSTTAWFRFLDSHNQQIVAVSQVDEALLRMFITWLDRHLPSKGSSYTAWSGVKQLIVWLQRNRPHLTHPQLALPFNPFPRKNAESRPRHVLERSEVEAVLAAARSDIDSSWATFRQGERAIGAVPRAAIAAEPDLRRLDLYDLGTFLSVINDRWNGFIPTNKEMEERRLWPLIEAVERHGQIHGATQYLHAVPETLIPYMIAIAAQTFANPDALRDFRRDCMTDHLLLDGRMVVSWRKGRASREQRRSFLRDKRLSVPHLITRVLRMTAPLVPHSLPKDRDKLFIYGGTQGLRGVRLMSESVVVNHVRRFAKRHDLKDEAGGRLPLTLVSLRSTGLTLAHAALGFDIFKTQALANHATPDTTQRYVDRPLVRKAQMAALGRLQGHFVEAMRGATSSEPVAKSIADANARHATASGFVCRDPMSGIGSDQTVGRLCTAWLGCFTCPNAVIPMEADVLARLLRTRAALISARAAVAPDRWRLLYAPKLEIIDRDIVPRYSLELQAAALALVGAMPAVPPIE
jgi:integrase